MDSAPWLQAKRLPWACPAVSTALTQCKRRQRVMPASAPMLVAWAIICASAWFCGRLGAAGHRPGTTGVPAPPPIPSLANSSQAAAASMRDLYLRTVQWAVTGSLYDEFGHCRAQAATATEPATACAPQHWGPYNHTIREQGNDWPAVAHTMLGHVRLVNIRQVLERVLADHVPGDFAEIGVWRGGACIYAKAVLAAHGVADRRVHVFDTFEPMRHQYREAADYLAASEEAVRHNFDKYGLLDDGVRFFKGRAEDVLPSLRSDRPIAVLRIDANYYEGYIAALHHLFPLVPPGGYVIFDDILDSYHPGAMMAWTDYKNVHGLSYNLTSIDVGHAAMFRK